ncbi:hypothetical protein BDZ45DRAFT_749239 [Acephala macrosclerotiorum]|nr:hypothetical protein BDZ45DRAFT_749239 [Acephala macrosclerotiorum]
MVNPENKHTIPKCLQRNVRAKTRHSESMPNCGAFTCTGVLESCEDYYVVCIKDTSKAIFEVTADLELPDKQPEGTSQLEKAGNQVHTTKANSKVSEEGSYDQQVKDKNLNDRDLSSKLSEESGEKQHERKEKIKRASEVTSRDQEAEIIWEEEAWDRALKAWKAGLLWKVMRSKS